MSDLSGLFGNNFRDDQKELILQVFNIEASPVPFREMGDGQLFMVPNTKVTNRYWKTKATEWGSYSSPIVCKKVGEDKLLELMTDYPSFPRAVSSSRLNDVAYLVTPRIQGELWTLKILESSLKKGT